jgi:hypothetical protein
VSSERAPNLEAVIRRCIDDVAASSGQPRERLALAVVNMALSIYQEIVDGELDARAAAVGDNQPDAGGGR